MPLLGKQLEQAQTWYRFWQVEGECRRSTREALHEILDLVRRASFSRETMGTPVDEALEYRICRGSIVQADLSPIDNCGFEATTDWRVTAALAASCSETPRLRHETNSVARIGAWTSGVRMYPFLVLYRFLIMSRSIALRKNRQAARHSGWESEWSAAR